MVSFKFKNVFLGNFSTISSKNEKINTKFTLDDYFGGENTSESSEVKMQKTVLEDMRKSDDIDVVLGADLSNQLGITNETMANYGLSYLGIYNACASFPEELIIGGMLLKSANIKNIACLVSSHNLAAERTFRFPIEYGSPRRITQTFTATGAICAMITKKPTNVAIESCTIGRVIEYGIKDVNNMGAIMAPAAADTLMRHLSEMKRDAGYYDIIMTGDLGLLGGEFFRDILSKNDITLKNYLDAGSILITDRTLTDQGASGPVCLPLVLLERILKDKRYKRILLLGTGALHNTTLVNQKKPVPAISHAVSLEVL